MLTIKIKDLLELSKYTDILKSDIKVQTENGLNKIYAVDVTAKNSDIIKINTSKHELLGSPNHLVKCEHEWVKIKDLNINDRINTKHGSFKITNIEKLDHKDDLLDLHVEGNEYYTNDITSHNSSLITGLDLALYGEEHNKKGKRLSKANFPNRINGNMKVGVEFETDEVINIHRSMDNKNSPIKTDLLIDKVPYKKAIKLQETIEEKIGFDFKTYKSFISMDVNNFKNFISLTPEDKRILLDKIFNLSIINDLNKILRELRKDNELKYNSIQKKINIYSDNINDLKQSVESIKEKQKLINEKKEVDTDKDISELKSLLKKYKEDVSKLEDSKKELKDSIIIFDNGIKKLNTKLVNINRDIKDTNEKIDLYNLGKCPTCETNLTGELNLKDTFIEKLEKYTEVKENLNNKINNANIELDKLKTLYTEETNSYQKILTDASVKKSELDKLVTEKNKPKEEDNSLDTISEFEKNIDKLNIKLEEKNENYLEIQKVKHIHDILIPMWSDNGIKQDIIDSIIDPINSYIQEDLEAINTRFGVQLDKNFNAIITEFNNEIDSDSLSTGEEKKINLIIMLAYIKMLRNKQNINILFLDEVFASIDIQGIDDILFLFKKFANERDINIFLIHHSELKEHLFDRIISIEKNTFSYLDEY